MIDYHRCRYCKRFASWRMSAHQLISRLGGPEMPKPESLLLWLRCQTMGGGGNGGAGGEGIAKGERFADMKEEPRIASAKA